MTKFSKDNQPTIRNNGPAVAESNVRRKIVTDALMVALNREIEKEGKMTKRINILADKVVLKAIDGDVPAFKEVRDTIDGKPQQSIDHTGDLGVNMVAEIKLIPSAD
jgi:hypothetical protein